MVLWKLPDRLGRSEPGELPDSGGSTSPRDSGGSATRSFRGDVEGLRAVAIGAVLFYHAGVAPLTGGYVGVDVFFVISGFLITGLLLREVERTGTISLVRFYTRRMRRLLPLTVLVLAAVVALSWPILSPLERRSVAGDVIAAGLYVINWRLAGEAVNYSDLGVHASPVEHFWSLAVEEQFYIIWPLLLLLVAWWCRRGGRGLRPRLAIALGTIGVGSLAYSVYLTYQVAGAAYFSTLTRSWELAAGGLLALIPTARLRLPRRAAGALALAGLAAIAVSIVTFSDSTKFPGAVALLPVLGAVAVVAAGSASTGTLAARLLSLPPVRHVGRVSYSWYLWHWPMIVFAAAWLGHLSAEQGLLVVAVSYLPAVLTHHLVENRFRHSRLFAPARTAFQLGVACTLGSVLLGVTVLVTIPTVTTAPPAQAKGAKVLRHTTGLQKTAVKLRPRPDTAKQDKGRMHADGCLVPQKDTRSPKCVYGDASSDTTVVLFGDSHAMQYFPALRIVAKQRDWRLVGLTKSGCTPAEVKTYNSQFKREYSECDIWRRQALARISQDEHPDLVITGNLATETVMRNGDKLDRQDSATAMEQGYVATLDKLRATGAKVAVIKDNPHPPEDVPACVSEHLDDLTDCAFPLRDGTRFAPVNSVAARQVNGVTLVDPTPVMCPHHTCPAVIGNVIVYRNTTHITATYMRTLAGWMGKQLPTVK